MSKDTKLPELTYNRESGKILVRESLLVEETANAADDFTIIPTSGEPYILQDTIGVLADNSLTWSSGGIEYYMVSDVLNQNELVEIASSISSLPTMK